MNFTNISEANVTFQGNDGTITENQIVSLSIQALRVIQIVNHLVLSGTICILGTIFNLINMIIFIQQGLNNTVNISMFAIAFSDLCSLVTLEWVNINLNPFMESADVPFEPAEVQYLTGGWPHACFLQITIWITVFVTAERCFCIVLPLKVKLIFTPIRVKIIIIVTYVLTFAALLPLYVALYFGENFYTTRNVTRVGLKARDIPGSLEVVTYMLFSVMGFTSFIMLVVFTCLLVVTLKRRSKWRKKSNFDEQKSKSMSKRDKKTMKMVGLIAFVLIICAAPGMIMSVAAFLEPEFNVNGAYGTIAHASWSFSFLSEAVNSTVNIIFFYKMSSKFRLTFFQLFSRCRKGDNADTGVDREQSSTMRVVPSVSGALDSQELSTDSDITNSKTFLTG